MRTLKKKLRNRHEKIKKLKRQRAYWQMVKCFSDHYDAAINGLIFTNGKIIGGTIRI
ncbi:MAG: hypothetical protein PHS34_08390 [Candidatus Omnitrophica bacterium]|nr:hypothetical protein [Candidatus Omnitrophota bacterium]